MCVYVFIQLFCSSLFLILKFYSISDIKTFFRFTLCICTIVLSSLRNFISFIAFCAFRVFFFGKCIRLQCICMQFSFLPIFFHSFSPHHTTLLFVFVYALVAFFLSVSTISTRTIKHGCVCVCNCVCMTCIVFVFIRFLLLWLSFWWISFRTHVLLVYFSLSLFPTILRIYIFVLCFLHFLLRTYFREKMPLSERNRSASHWYSYKNL